MFDPRVPAVAPPGTPPERPASDAALHKAADGLEATFLAEMLKFAGFGKARESFGGGIGEEQFGSFLRQAQAEAMVRHGGIGLAQHLFEAMKERANDPRT